MYGRYEDPSIVSYFYLVRDEDESVMVKASQVGFTPPLKLTKCDRLLFPCCRWDWRPCWKCLRREWPCWWAAGRRSRWTSSSSKPTSCWPTWSGQLQTKHPQASEILPKPENPKNQSKTLIVVPNFVMIVINKIFRSIIISWILNCSEYLLYPRWIFWTYPKRWSRQCCNSYRTERGLGNRKVANDQWMFCSMLRIISACWPWINIQ